MNKTRNIQSQHNGELSSLATCMSCIYMIRYKDWNRTVACVSHLKVMSGDTICELYSPARMSGATGWTDRDTLPEA